MATRVFNVVGTISGNAPEIRAYTEEAAQSFLAGDPVFLNANGKIAICTDGGPVLGIAESDASGVTDAAINIAILNGDTIFSAPGKINYALTHRNKVYDLDLTTGAFTVDLGTTAGDQPFHIIDGTVGATAGVLVKGAVTTGAGKGSQALGNVATS